MGRTSTHTSGCSHTSPVRVWAGASASVRPATSSYRRAMRWWEWVGPAGLRTVAATGVVVDRPERKRRAYTPEDVRARLHERVAQAAGSGRA